MRTHITNLQKCLLLTCLVLAASQALGANIDGTKSDESSGRVWGDGHDHVVLVKVTQSTITKSPQGGQRFATYEANVRFDMDGSLAGKAITMAGNMDNFNSAFDTANLKRGDISAIHISPQEKTDVFTCMPSMFLPIGLQTNIALHSEDVKPVETAMKEAIDNLPLKEKSREKAEIFLKDHNYFLWALGVEMIAQEHTKESVDRLRELQDLTKPQFLWLMQTLGEVINDTDVRIRLQNNLYFNYISKDVRYPAEFTP